MKFREFVSATLLRSVAPTPPLSPEICDSEIRLNMRTDLRLTIYRAFLAAAPQIYPIFILIFPILSIASELNGFSMFFC